MTLSDKVKNTLAGVLPDGGGVGVAVSGGSDSMCLLDCLLRFRIADKARLMVINVDHGIRGEESARDSAFVADYCRERGLRLTAVKCDVPALAAAAGDSLETAARKFRSALFARLCAENTVTAVLTAHNAYDRTETLLMHILRGSGMKGLVGMTARDGNIVRPLLDCTKPEIMAYIETYGVPYVEDSTNADPRYTRNFLRGEILPLLRARYPGTDRALSGLSDAAAALLSELDAASPVTVCEDGSALIPAAKTSGENIVGAFVKAGLATDFTKAHVSAVKALAHKPSGTGCDLPHGYRAEREPDTVRVYRDFATPAAEIPFRVGRTELPFAVVSAEKCAPVTDKSGSVFDLDKLPAGAVIRTRRSGDKFTPAGGREKLLSDWLTDKKIPRYIKRRLLYVAAGREVLAVIGMATGEKIKLDEKTTDAVRVTAGVTER